MHWTILAVSVLAVRHIDQRNIHNTDFYATPTLFYIVQEATPPPGPKESLNHEAAIICLFDECALEKNSLMVVRNAFYSRRASSSGPEEFSSRIWPLSFALRASSNSIMLRNLLSLCTVL